MNEPGYKPICPWAVISATLAVPTVLSFVAIPFALLGVVAACAIIVAHKRIRRYDLFGHRLVVAATTLSAASLVVAPARHVYLYDSEALPAYERVCFADVDISESTAFDQYENTSICLKGYALPPARMRPTRSFLFSPDGDLSNPNNSITVTLTSAWNYDDGPVSVSGIMRVNRNTAGNTKRYVLSGAEVRKARTTFGLQPRLPGKG